MPESLLVTYTPRSVPSENVANTVVLEQEDWNVYAGKMTNTSMVNAIANLLYGPQSSVGSAVGDSSIGDPDSSSSPAVITSDQRVITDEDDNPILKDGVYYDSNGNPYIYGERLYTRDTGAPSSGYSMVGRATVYFDADRNPVVNTGERVYTSDGTIIEGTGQALAPTTSLGDSSPALDGSNTTIVDCSNVIDGNMVAAVYAYPIPGTLNYSLRVSHGRVGRRTTRYETFRELIQVRLHDIDTPLAPKYPVHSLSTYEWFGDVYNEEGEVVTSKPRIYAEDYELYVRERVYGTLDVSYRVKRDIYKIVVPPRPGLVGKEAYHTVVYAVFDGGVTWLEIDPTPEVEAESSCDQYQYIVNWKSRDPEDYHPIPRDKTEYYDYCLLEKTGESIL